MHTSIASPTWEFEIEQPFPMKAARVGAQAGAIRLGASVYELGPGATASPLHLHHGNEELVVVLSGSPLLRRLDGREQLAVGDIVALPAGREGAHRIENDGPETARVLIVSTMRFPDVVEHPDSNKVLLLTGSPQEDGEILAFLRSSVVHPLDGEADLSAVSEQLRSDPRADDV